MLFKKKITQITFLVTVFVTLLSSYGCEKDGNKNPGYPKNVTIEYKLTPTPSGINLGNVLYTNETGGVSSLSAQALPFSKTVSRTVNQFDGIALSITASGNGSVKAEIFVNNSLVKTETYSSNTIISGTLAYVFP